VPEPFLCGVEVAMDAKCLICFGIGWVCENHPNLAWHQDLGCVCGAGMPCECNRAGEPGVEEPDTSQLISEKHVTRH
jgi:hypothetical protein